MSVGAQLRASREAKGLSIDAVARTTRVHPRILAAIERDDVTAVPPRPFGRGFVRSYAREIGLDPDQIARDYFAQFTPAPASIPSATVTRSPAILDAPRGRYSSALVTLGIAAGLATALIIGRSPASERRPGVPQPVGTSGASAPSAPAPVDVPAPAAAPAAITRPTPSISPGHLSVVLTASQPSWVQATADGRRALYQMMLPGAPQTITAMRNIEIRVGDAGALRWQINGRDAGVVGRPGQVRDIVITPGNAATIR